MTTKYTTIFKVNILLLPSFHVNCSWKVSQLPTYSSPIERGLIITISQSNLSDEHPKGGNLERLI
jgi:hypothetical protein